MTDSEEYDDTPQQGPYQMAPLPPGQRMALPMPPSLRRSYRGQSKRSKAQRARKGIPPWKLR